jgi:hypothetical protein
MSFLIGFLVSCVNLPLNAAINKVDLPAISQVNYSNISEITINNSFIPLAAGDLKPLSASDLKAIDAHALKAAYVGKSEVSKFDIFVDNNGRGNLVLVKKSDTKVQVPTDLSVQEAKESYPAQK